MKSLTTGTIFLASCTGIILSAFLLTAPALGSVGTEGAAFLEVPVGAEPAALGSAYSALAQNAYAPVWNPAGLGSLKSDEIGTQHLSYIDSIHYEYLSYVHPFAPAKGSAVRRSLGVSVQYLGSGGIKGTNDMGDPTGDFSSRWGAYNLAYGQTVTEKLSLGLTGKWINAKIEDISANAFALDLGALYKESQKLTMAATVTNLGTKLKFLSDGDPLPLAIHLAGAFVPSHFLLATSELVLEKAGAASFRLGGAWTPIEAISLRAGYRTDVLKGLGALAGLSAGLGLHLWGQELGYAWVPYGDLGNTHYISLLIRWGESEEAKKNLIQFRSIKTHRTVRSGADNEATDPDLQRLMEIFSEDDEHVAQSPKKQ